MHFGEHNNRGSFTLYEDNVSFLAINNSTKREIRRDALVYMYMQSLA